MLNGPNNPSPHTVAEVLDNMPVNRSVGRDVHIYNAKDPDIILGGLRLTRGVTNANLYAMIDIFCIFESSYVLHGNDKTVLLRNNDPLRSGKYFIVTEGTKLSYTIP